MSRNNDREIRGTVRFNADGLAEYRDQWNKRDKAWRDDDARKAEIALVSASNSEKSGHDAATLRNLLTTARDAWAGEDTSERWWRNDIDRYLEEVDELVEFCVRYNQPANVYAIYDGVGMVVGIGTRLIFLYQPSVLISHYEPVKDYTDVSVGELRALAGKKGGGVSATLPASPLDTVSVSQAQNELSDKKAALEALRASIREVEDGTNAELRSLKEEVERAMAALNAKKESLMAHLSAQKEELEEKVEQMNDQIYLLESQIYAICCYMGETVNFAKIRSGKNAKDTEPVVLYQKLRFLDEEMGRLTSIYGMKESKLKYFEEFLAASPIALETFAPSERCVTLVRLSKTGKRFGRSEEYANMLEQYQIYHGNTIGIIIRNGENVYIGWTDPEEIHVTDDFIMDLNPKDFKVNTGYIGQETDEQRKLRIKEERMQARAVAKEMVSRIFLFNILQGIVDGSNILPLPKGVCISKESEYVVFSMADRWLTDNQYGSFADIIKKCNTPDPKKGDSILTVLKLIPSNIGGSRYKTWSNDRGRGEKNRTHDCSVSDCKIYSMNLVEYDEPVERTTYKFNGHTFITDGDGSSLGEDCEIIGAEQVSRPHFFVSVEKAESGWRREMRGGEAGKKARSNFEVYRDEFINLAFMNSEWLLYAINNRNLGGWVIGGQCVDYAYGIKYLNVALQNVRQREAAERDIIEAKMPGFTSEYPGWMVKLSEWKIQNNVHRLHSRNVSAFLAFAHQ